MKSMLVANSACSFLATPPETKMPWSCASRASRPMPPRPDRRRLVGPPGRDCWRRRGAGRRGLARPRRPPTPSAGSCPRTARTGAARGSAAAAAAPIARWSRRAPRAAGKSRLPELAADERGFAVLSKLRGEHASDLSLVDFKALVRDQFPMLELDEAQAVATVPVPAARPWRSGRQGFGAARERGDGARAAGPGGGAASSSDRRAIHGWGRLDGGRR